MKYRHPYTLAELRSLATLVGPKAEKLAEQPDTIEHASAFIDRDLKHHEGNGTVRPGVAGEKVESQHNALHFAEQAYGVLAGGESNRVHEAERLISAGLAAVRPSAIMRSPIPRRGWKPGSLVSVIVNNYNYARFLDQAIDSALAQSYAPLEVIVVDDGSTDGSREVIERYGSRVRAVLKENGGQGSAFNAGFQASHGDVVIFLDADDVLLPTAVERAVTLFEPGVVKVHWPLWEIDADARRTGTIQPQFDLAEGDLRDRSIYEGPLVDSPPTSGNAWSRDLLKQMLPVPEQDFRINADGYLLALAWIYGEVRTLSEPVGLYRVHGDNHFATATADEKKQRHLEKFDHQCEALAVHLRALGVKPDIPSWKELKRVYLLRVPEAITKQLHEVLPAESNFIFVDEGGMMNVSQSAELNARRAIPFLEQDGEYWGRPEDASTAIAAVERLRAEGADFIVFVWYTFWWLDHYKEFGRYLRQNFSELFSNENLLVIDLRHSSIAGKN